MALQYPREMLATLFAERRMNPTPSERASLFALVDTVFFASLMIEEGESVRVAVVHDAAGAAGLAKVVDVSTAGDGVPRLAWDVTAITRRPFEAATLAKVSRGLEYGRQLVVVGGDERGLWIDGIARRLPRTDGGDVVRIAAPRPGVLVFERRSEQILRFEAGAEITPPIDVLGREGPVRAAVHAITGEAGDSESLTGEGAAFYSYPESALRQLIAKMRGTGAGAIFAMLPTEPTGSMLEEVRLRRIDVMQFANRIKAFKEHTGEWIRGRATRDGHLRIEQVGVRDAARAAAELAEETLDAAIDDLAQLSAIDGAVLAGPGLAVYGAGYLIPSTTLTVEPVLALDVAGEITAPYAPRYGARHRAAFSLADANPGAVAFVVSEDGPVSCALERGDQLVVWSVLVLET